MDVTPDCSTDGSTRFGTTSGVQSSTNKREKERRAVNVICGLSRRVVLAVVLRLNVEELRLELGRRGIAVESNRRRDMSNQLWDEIEGNARNKEGQGTVMESGLSPVVSLAVLLRLHMDELRYELNRRNIHPSAEDSPEGLMNRLFDEMGKEYFGQQASTASLENSTRNTPIQDQEAPTEPEETNEAAPLQEAPPRATRTTDAEPTLDSPPRAEGIGDAGAGEPLGETTSKAADTDDVIFVEEYMPGTDTNAGGGPSVGGSSNTRSKAAMKRQQLESNTRLDTPTKRCNRWKGTTNDSSSHVTTPESTLVAEPIQIKQEFENMSELGETPEFGAGPESGATTGIYDFEGSMNYSPLPSPQKADNRMPCWAEGCKFKSRSLNVVDEHFKGVHLREKQFRCELCGWRTAWMSNLRAHIKKQHP